MITYKYMSEALYARLDPFGFCHVDGKPTSNDDAACQVIIDAYTLDEAKAEKSAQVSARAKDLRDKAVAGISPGEMASWALKLMQASQYAATGKDSDAPMLAAEAQARGITVASLVGKVGGNSQRLSALEAAIGGVDGKHRDAIAALSTFEEVATYDFSGGWPEL